MKYLAPFIITMLLLSCQTTTFFKPVMEPDLLGVVYDKNNIPIENGNITITSENSINLESYSDINGQFLIENLPVGEYKVKFTSDSVIPLEVKYTHSSPNNVLILRVESLNSLGITLKEYLQNNQLDLARSIIEKLENLKTTDPYLTYLHTIYLYKSNRFNEAKVVINSIQNIESEYVKMLIKRIKEKLND